MTPLDEALDNKARAESDKTLGVLASLALAPATRKPPPPEPRNLVGAAYFRLLVCCLFFRQFPRQLKV